MNHQTNRKQTNQLTNQLTTLSPTIMNNLNNKPETLAEAINFVAFRTSKHVKAEFNAVGEVSPERLNVLIETRMNVFSFENDNARSFFRLSVLKAMDKKAYELVYPKKCMDSTGNYTTNKEKWA